MRALVFFVIRQKFIYIVDKLFNKNRFEKIDAHVVLSFVFPTKTLLNKKLLNTVKYARAARRDSVTDKESCNHVAKN